MNKHQKDKLLEESDSYALSRKLRYTSTGNKKASVENMRQEIVVARILGEMSGVERVVSLLVENPEWDRNDIEGELHKFIVSTNNMALKYMGSTSKTISVDDVLEAHSYFSRNKEGTK